MILTACSILLALQVQKEVVPFGTELMHYKDKDFWTWTIQQGDSKPVEFLGLIQKGEDGKMSYTDPVRVIHFTQNRKSGDIFLLSDYNIDSKETTRFEPPKRSLSGDLSGATYEFVGVTPAIIGSSKLASKETISTPIGRVETRKFVRESEDSTTTYWFNANIGVNVKFEVLKKETGEILTILIKKTNVLD